MRGMRSRGDLLARLFWVISVQGEIDCDSLVFSSHYCRMFPSGLIAGVSILRSTVYFTLKHTSVASCLEDCCS